MKLKKIILLLLIFLVALVGCAYKIDSPNGFLNDGKDEVETGNSDEDDEEDESEVDDENALSAEKSLYLKEYTLELDFNINEHRSVNLVNYSGLDIIKVDTYDEYLNLPEVMLELQEYDEDYFEKSSLIIYTRLFSSISIQLDFESIGLYENNNLIIKVRTLYPEVRIGVFDSRVYFIEYEKVSEEINHILISEKSYVYNTKTFYVIASEVNRIQKFIDEHGAFKFVLVFSFEDDYDKKGRTKEEIEAYYEAFNKEKYIKHGLDRIEGNVIRSFYSPEIIASKFNLDFDLLLEVLNTDELIKIKLYTYYFKIEYK